LSFEEQAALKAMTPNASPSSAPARPSREIDDVLTFWVTRVPSNKVLTPKVDDAR
jgi:hypothetical protein